MRYVLLHQVHAQIYAAAILQIRDFRYENKFERRAVGLYYSRAFPVHASASLTLHYKQ
jgi:hypothetical protein